MPDEMKTEQIKMLRRNIDEQIGYANSLDKSRAMSLVITKLEEAKMWAGKCLQEIGHELPVEYQDKAK